MSKHRTNSFCTAQRMVLIILALLLSGCLSHSRMPWSARASVNFDPQTDRIFDYEQASLGAEVRSDPDQDFKHYTMSTMVFNSSGDNGQHDDLVTADYFESDRLGAKPLIIVLPIWGTFTFPPERMVSTIRKKSRGRMNILRIHGDDPLYDWNSLAAAQTEEEFKAGIAQGTNRVRNTVVDLRRIVDWASTREEIDVTRIALIGFSMGAIVSSIAISNEPRIPLSVLVMGGAHPSQIFAHCNGKLGTTRTSIQERFGWDREQYRDAVEDVLSHGNVANYAKRVNPRGVLVIEAGKDSCMPRESRDALWQAMGEPARITLNYGHKMSFMAMTNFGLNLLPRQAYRFLRVNFLRGATPAVTAPETRVTNR